MYFSLDGKFWTLDEIGDVEWFMLVQLPQAADINQSEKGRERLLPDPIRDSDEEEFLVDWKEFVVPELETQFTQDVEKVAADLDRAEEFEEDGNLLRRVSVPNDHAETWYRVLNQARLIINEEHDMSKVEESLILGENNPSEVGEKRWLVMVQFRIYAAIQEFLLSELMDAS